VDGVEPSTPNDDYLNIKFQFSRNLPVNLLEEAQTTALFKGNIPEKARLSLLSFITDVQQALDDMHADQLEESTMYDDKGEIDDHSRDPGSALDGDEEEED
jgi:hypothetical protein